MSKDFSKAIQDLEKRVSTLERKVLKTPAERVPPGKKGDFAGATGGIRFLVSKEFFNRKRAFAEIRKELANKGYHYSPQAVQTALNRASKPGSALVSLKEGKRKMYATRK